MGFFLTGIIRNLLTSFLTIIQTSKMHREMVHSLIRSEVSFFDSNPVGRILNRFSKDISLGDMVLPVISTWFIDQLLIVVSIMILLCVAIPWATLAVAVVVVIVLLIRFKALLVQRESLKLDLMTRSPVATVLGASLSGLTTIRAYEKMPYFQSKFEGLLDANGRAFFTFHDLSRAIAFYLDILSGVLVISAVFVSLLVRTDENPLVLALGIQLVT